MLPPDNHVHSRWSWDTSPSSSMQLACQRAVAVGLPGLAFTEHLDFTDWGDGDDLAGITHPPVVGTRPHVLPLDIEGYQRDLQRCRETFPQLRILSGIEAGEPHHFAGSIAAVLAAGEFERVLGSLHAIEHEGRLEYVDEWLFDQYEPDDLMRAYFEDMVGLVSSAGAFQVLAHCDFPRRYWPDRAGKYDETRYEEEYRTVFRALASSGRALEINTRSPLSSVDLIRWWWQEGGDAVSFGSDAHVPYRVGARFDLAVDIVEAAGFRPGQDPHAFWRR